MMVSHDLQRRSLFFQGDFNKKPNPQVNFVILQEKKKKKKRHYTYYLGDSLDAKEVTKNIWAAQNSYGFPSCNGKGIVKEIKKIIKKNGQLVWVKCLCHLCSELSSPTKTKETFNCLKDVH